ncbi:43663_t:CDS:2, partial [Gigaspora margarita]
FKEVTSFWESIAERKKRHAAEEHDYKLLEQVRNKHVLIGGADVVRVQEEYIVDEELLEASIEKRQKDEDSIESTPATNKNRDLEEDFFIEECNISKLFQQYQSESINLANSSGLYIETNIHEILALTSIFMLTPNSYSEMMISSFGKRELDAECESKFRRIIKQSINDSQDSAIKFSIAYLTDNNSKENLGFVILEGLRLLSSLKLKSQLSEMSLITNYLDYIMKGLFHEPDKYRVEWLNTGLKESRARKLEGRARQPDFIVSAINQLETSGTLFVGEVTASAKKGNVYKNCKDLIRISVFMKECIDLAIDKGADIKLLGFQCI